MATQSASNPNLGNASSEDNVATLTGTDLRISLPHWAKTILVITTVVSTVGATIAGLANHFSGDRANDAKSRLADVQIKEKVRHSAEDFKTLPIASALGAENLELRYYSSDGCILVARKTLDGHLNSAYYVPRVDSSQVDPAPGPIADAPHIRSDSMSRQRDHFLPAPLLSDPPLAAFVLAPGPRLTPPQSCSGHCSDPHPGQPKISNGQVNGCWIQVIRTWDDGCSQYQWYETCHSIWDPKIYWSCCKH